MSSLLFYMREHINYAKIGEDCADTLDNSSSSAILLAGTSAGSVLAITHRLRAGSDTSKSISTQFIERPFLATIFIAPLLNSLSYLLLQIFTPFVAF